jgi:NADH-quinone oxidoreductase subunit K
MEGLLYPITLTHYLVLGAALFLIGALGVLVRRNLVIMLMSIELMLNGVNVNLIAFSKLHGDVQGQVFAIFIIAVAVAEAAIGLGILIAVFRNKMTVQADEIQLLKW